MKNRIRIILADDHSVLRVGLKMLLESESHFSVVGEAADGEELLTLLEKTETDVVVVDLSMPKMGGAGMHQGNSQPRHGCKNTGFDHVWR